MSLCSKFWNQEMWIFLFCFPFSELFWLFWVSYYSLLILQPSCQFLWRSQLEFSRFCWIWGSEGCITVLTKLIFLVNEIFLNILFILILQAELFFLVLFWVLDTRIEIRLIFVSCNFVTCIHMFVLLLLRYNSILSYPLWRIIIVIYINALIL